MDTNVRRPWLAGLAALGLVSALVGGGVPARAADPAPDCPASTPAVLPAVDTQPTFDAKPVAVSYGRLPLVFTATPTTGGAYCTLVSNRGALPVYLRIYANVAGHKILLARPHVADSVTTATLDFSRGPLVRPVCDFSQPTPLTAAADDCYLNQPTGNADGVVVRWSIPGFVEYTPDQHGVAVYSTRPLTYLVDVTALGVAPTDVQDIEAFIHVTLISHLPAVDPIGIVQDPPAHVHVTDPLGRSVGWVNGRVAAFPGAGYVEVGDRSVAWILNPPAGRYAVQAIGRGRGGFSLDFGVLGRGGPSVRGTLPADGVAKLAFATTAAASRRVG